MLRNIPWVSLIGAVWAAIRLNWWGLHIALGYNTSFGVVLLLVAFGALLIEFWKSVDINQGSFYLDLFFALVTLGSASAVITVLYQRADWDLIDIFIFGVLAADAYLSPVFAFRTALRNVEHGL